VVGLEDVGDERVVWLWPGGSGSFTEATAEGVTYAWAAGDLARPVVSATWNGEAIAVGASGVVDVSGAGTLVLTGAAGGAGTLVVTGGTLHVQLR
jgi:hypothetical protein